MTMLSERPQSIPGSEETLNPLALIEEARQIQRRHHRWVAVATSVIVLSVVGFLASEGGTSKGTPTRPTGGARGGPQIPYLTSASTHSGFVLLPSWLPPGFSASAGGWIKPVGGLKTGSKVGVSVEYGGVGPESKPRVDPVLFTLSYYGFHNPESKSIRLIATRYGDPPQGSLETLGGRHVEISSKFEPGYFGGNTNSSASWVEHGEYVSVMAQGITKAQLSRFVAGLKEHPRKLSGSDNRQSGS